MQPHICQYSCKPKHGVNHLIELLAGALTASAAVGSLDGALQRCWSYASSCVMGGHACRSSTRSWKSSQTRAASSSSRKRARLFPSVSTSSICTWEEGGRDKSAAAGTHTRTGADEKQRSASEQPSHPFQVENNGRGGFVQRALKERGLWPEADLNANKWKSFKHDI